MTGHAGWKGEVKQLENCCRNVKTFSPYLVSGSQIEECFKHTETQGLDWMWAYLGQKRIF